MWSQVQLQPAVTSIHSASASCVWNKAGSHLTDAFELSLRASGRMRVGASAPSGSTTD